MRVQPDNLIEVWLGAKKDILADHPELPEPRAGELAAAIVFNWLHEDWTKFRDEVRDEFMNPFSAGEMEMATRIDPQRLQLYGELTDWTPLRRLQQVSGSRTLLRDLDDPIVTEQSTPPAELIAIKNHWKTERIPETNKLETLWDLKQAWADIGAEFRGRRTGGGCLYTNHQGFHAIQTTFERLHKTSYGEHVGGLTVNLYSAEGAIDYLRQRAGELGGKAGENLERLADLFEEAISDALANKKEGVSIVDTTYPGIGDDLPFTVLKKSLRHEAAHVWEYTIDPDKEALVSDRMIKADPDYPRLQQWFSKYYENIKPAQIASEAMAFVISGDWKKGGFVDEEQALKFIDRFLSNVVLRYGKKALDRLHLTHPTTKEVIENVRSIPIRELRARRRAARDVEGGSQGAGEGTGPDRKAPRGRAAIRAAQSRLAGGWTGEDARGLRGHGPEPGAIRFSDQAINLSNIETAKQTDLHLPGDNWLISPGRRASQETLTASSQTTIAINGRHQSRQGIGVGVTTASFGRNDWLSGEELLVKESISQTKGVSKMQPKYGDDNRDTLTKENGEKTEAARKFENLEMSAGTAGAEIADRNQAVAATDSARSALNRWDIVNKIHAVENSGCVTEKDAAEWAKLNSQLATLDKSSLNADLSKSLQTISAIESIDPDGMRYTWRDLAVKSAEISRESLARYEMKAGNLGALSEGRMPAPVELSKDNYLVEALREIADIESLDPTKYSWKDRATMAIDIAREALNPAQRELTAGDEIRSEENRVEPRGRSMDYALCM
jgi:hypothetical protein